MTDHPCAGRSRAMVEVFEAIAISQQPPFRPRTITALLKAGLIVQVGDRVLTRDRFGEVRVPVYEVPLAIHMQWCRWCDETVPDEDTQAEAG